MSKYPIPFKVYDYLELHFPTDTKTLQEEFDLAARTARRYIQHYREGTAARSPRPILRLNRPSESAPEPEEFNLQEYIQIFRKLQQLNEEADPVTNIDYFEFETDQPVAITFASCMHLGSRYVEYELFEEVLEEILSIENLYFGSLGDDIEGYISSFRDAGAVESQLIPVKAQREILRNVLKMIVDQEKLLFGCGSQHGGDWEDKRSGLNPIKRMYLDLGVPFYDGTSYLKVQVGEEVYFIAVAHQFPGHSQWNPSHPQMRALRERFPMADVVVMGDKHSPVKQRVPAFPDEFHMGNRKSDYAWLLQAGTLKTGMDKFTIKRWATGMYGWPIVILYPKEHKVDVTFYFDEAQEKLSA